MAGVIYEKNEGIAYITLNRPEAMNAMNSEMWDAMVGCWETVRDDPDIRVAIVSGAGEKSFSAGQDLKELSEWMKIPDDERPILPIPELTPMRGLQVWKPFIAAINGVCIGGGLELAMACDIRIASDNAVLGLAEVKHGLIAGNGGNQRLARLVPLGTALEMLITGSPINAQEAHRIGLVNRVVPLGQLMPLAEALAAKICQNAPLAVQAAKESVFQGMGMSLDEAINAEAPIIRRLGSSDDAKEGPRAFVEKRIPNFKAR